MASFPSLRPDSRKWSSGLDQTSVERGVRFRHSAQLSGGTVTMGYRFLAASDTAQIRSHVSGQRGAVLSFELGADAWAGHETADDVFSPATFRHQGGVSENQLSAGLANLTVTLSHTSDA